jgi:hypothetical protein
MKSKEDEYTVKVISHMAKLFDEDEAGDNFIDKNELADDNNMTDLTHAIVNLAPAVLISKLTGTAYHLLQFNHMANQLIFQYNRKKE